MNAIVSSRSIFLVLLTMLLVATAPQRSSAVVMTDIIASQPAANGGVSFTITDTNHALSVNVNVAGILATDTPAQKAAKLSAAATTAIDANDLDMVFSSSVAGNKTTITKIGGGGMAVNITADSTGEGSNLRTRDSGGNGNNFFWRFVRWFFASADTVVPSNHTYALATTNDFNATVTSDGIKTASQLENELTAQLEDEGVVFTEGTDPLSGQQFLASQEFPVGALFPADGVGIATSPGFGDFLGGIGVELRQTPQPPMWVMFCAGLIVLIGIRRKMRW